MNLVLVLSLGLVLAVGQCAANRVVCYFATWAYEYTGLGNFLVSDIDTSLCTHVMYAFVGIGENGEIRLQDEGYDIGMNGLADFGALRQNNSDLHTMISVGGWNEGSTNFSIVAANETLRNTFAANAVALLEKYNCTGLDIDWEYPNQRDGSTAADYDNYILLLQALKDAFSEKGYLLSAAVSATQSAIDLSYNVTALNEVLDFINIMAYDFHGTWDAVTGVNAPLYAQSSDAEDTVLTVNASVIAWLSNGADADKLVLGLGNYGHAYTLADAANNGTGANITDAAYYAPYTNETSTWNYIEICSDQVNNTNSWAVTNYKNSYVYAVKDTLWIGYDNADTMYAKGSFAKAKGLGGIMFWALHGDDFAGYCGDKWPLINAGKNGYAGTSRR